MRIVGQIALQKAARKHADASNALAMWRAAVTAARWANLVQLKDDFPSADYVLPFTVFNVKGNKYRLIALIDYAEQIVLVRNFLTHATYSKGEMEMTATAEREYAQLLSKRRPHAIGTKGAYDAAMREIEELTIRGEGRSAAETEYYRVLCALVADYERHVGADRWQKLTPVEALRELMALKDVNQAKVAGALGDRAAASSILSGRRKVSKAQAKKLGDLFNVDAGVFI